MWYVSILYVETPNKYVHFSFDAEKELTDRGVSFEDNKLIKSMTDAAREFISDPSTPEFIANFACGAEYGKFINPTVQFFPYFSVPHLFVLAMTPKNSDDARIKALKNLR